MTDTIYNNVMDNANYKWRISRVTGKRYKVAYYNWWRCTCKVCESPFWAVRKKDDICPACQTIKETK
jgi:rubrerythrin